jgi:uncharacterized protein YdeI (YjbR/CyaY-like superfamily)
VVEGQPPEGHGTHREGRDEAFWPARGRASQGGRWEAAYDAQSTATVPDDMHRELEKNHRALGFFSKLESRNRYAILYQIQDAKRPETRARRIEKYVAMLAEHKKLYP